MNPFDLNDQQAYQSWREQKLTVYLADVSELIVTVETPWYSRHQSTRH